MIKALKNKYALSNQGAKDLLKGIIYSVLANISLMFPVILLAIVLNQLLAPILGMNAPEISAIVYTVIGIVILAVVFIFHYCQYTAAYLGTYDESARRRISLAEKLRTLPLTFFHQRDIADLTSTIMGDCANFEHAFSHTVPQFFGAVISTGIVCVGLLIFNWQMGLALLWVAPISFAIVLLSRKWQEKLSKKHMNARLELAEGIQECLETVQDIKACNQEEDYLRKLDAKMDAAEKAQISSEMTTASLLTTGQMFLRLGLATVIVVGNSLVVNGNATTQQVAYGGSAVLPAVNIPGYVFMGWDRSPDNITENCTITAILVPDGSTTDTSATTYTVTFVVDGVSYPVTVSAGSSAVAPVSPTINSRGQTFIGWDTDFSNVTHDLTVTALFL